MSAHRLTADLAHGSYKTLYANGATIAVDRSPLTLNITTAGSETCTLSAPGRADLVANLSCGTYAGNCVVTVLDSAGATTGTITFGAAAQLAQLWSFELATGVYTWVLVTSKGVTTTMPQISLPITVPTQTQTSLTNSTGGSVSTTLAAITTFTPSVAWDGSTVFPSAADATAIAAAITSEKNSIASIAAQLVLIKADVAAILAAI